MDRNFATIAMLVALALLLVTLTILVAACGVKAESPLVNTLATGAVGLAGAVSGISIPKGEQKPEAPKPS